MPHLGTGANSRSSVSRSTKVEGFEDVRENTPRLGERLHGVEGIDARLGRNSISHPSGHTPRMKGEEW